MAGQTWDQQITFRNFNYARALEVVQDEEYLDDVDFDGDIRLIRKQGEVFQAIDNFNEKIENNFLSEDSNILGEFDNEHEESHHRVKRRLDLLPPTVTTLSCNDFENMGYLCSLHPWEILAKVLVGIGIVTTMFPRPGSTPDGSPRCGEPGGGGCPGDNNPGNILDLVPAGLTAVATFPPFVPTFRTIPAVAAIFKEPLGTFAGENTGGAGFEPFRRSSGGYSRQPSLLDRFRKNVRCLGPRLDLARNKLLLWTMDMIRQNIKPGPVVDYGYGKAKYFLIVYIYIWRKMQQDFFLCNFEPLVDKFSLISV